MKTHFDLWQKGPYGSWEKADFEGGTEHDCAKEMARRISMHTENKFEIRIRAADLRKKGGSHG